MPMKIIVCFDNVKVTVPCGDGQFSVAELISKAIHRFKRATGKNAGQQVKVSTLKSISGGGILDPDDLLADVVDDREQLLAEFELTPGHGLLLYAGDGASASSTGTPSPDLFQCLTPPLPSSLPPQNTSTSNNANADPEVVVTPKDLSVGSKLHVRRGSDPCLTVFELGVPELQASHPLQKDHSLPQRRESVRESDEPWSESSDEEKHQKLKAMTGSLDRKRFGNRRFIRDSNRASLGGRPVIKNQIFDLKEKAENLRYTKMSTKERVGPVEDHDTRNILNLRSDDHPIVIENDGGPLGIHAVPATDVTGAPCGLLIQSVEPGRPIHRDGRILPNHIVNNINGISLLNIPFLRAQEIFRAALESPHISLGVTPTSCPHTPSPPPASPKAYPAPPPPQLQPKHSKPAILPRSHIPKRPSPLTVNPDHSDELAESSKSHPIDKEAFAQSFNSVSFITSKNNDQKFKQNMPLMDEKRATNQTSELAHSKPAKKNSLSKPTLSQAGTEECLSGVNQPLDLPLNCAFNTRKIGKKRLVELQKGPLGLGFSVTSRDNEVCGEMPIYIKTILPQGAAVHDGQLRPGDRLLEVNEVAMTGKSQKEAVELLRELPKGSLVKLLVSRQEEVEEKFKMPRKMSDNVPSTHSIHSGNPMMSFCHPSITPDFTPLAGQPADTSPPGGDRDRITFQVAPNDTGSAGLGVSVKGKTEPTDSGLRDLGIYVNSVLQGGAASKDGRLEVNDQLLAVNGVSLEDCSNVSAMEALRQAMLQAAPGTPMAVTVARAHSTNPPTALCPSNQQPTISPLKQSSLSKHTSVVLHKRSSSASEVFQDSPLRNRFGSVDIADMPSPIPPVRSKRIAILRDQVEKGLRNDSYIKANNDHITHDSSQPGGIRNDSYLKATTLCDSNSVPGIRNESYHEAIEDCSKDSLGFSLHGTSKSRNTVALQPERPHSSVGFLHEGEDGLTDTLRRASMASSSTCSDISPSVDLILPFAREGFGRQSMSEKRKGHKDPRKSEIYNQVVGKRDEKKELAGETSPLNKQDDVINVVVNEDKRVITTAAATLTTKTTAFNHSNDVSAEKMQLQSTSPNQFGRTRPCNESFRAAVDRSYDALDPSLMDTLEEESAESGAFTLDMSHSGRSSLSSNPSEGNLTRSKAKTDKLRNPGLLKGFLRFGKGRRSQEEAMRRSRSEERHGDRPFGDRQPAIASEPTLGLLPAASPHALAQQPVNSHHSKPRRTSNHIDDSCESSYAQLRDQHLASQRLRSQSVDPSQGVSFYSSPGPTMLHAPRPKYPPTMASTRPRAPPRPARLDSWHHPDQPQKDSSASTAFNDLQPDLSAGTMSRAEYVSQLRWLFQQQHQARRGVYPRDAQEEREEKRIQEMETRWGERPTGTDDGSWRKENIFLTSSDSSQALAGLAYGASYSVPSLHESYPTRQQHNRRQHQLPNHPNLLDQVSHLNYKMPSSHTAYNYDNSKAQHSTLSSQHLDKLQFQNSFEKTSAFHQSSFSPFMPDNQFPSSINQTYSQTISSQSNKANTSKLGCGMRYPSRVNHQPALKSQASPQAEPHLADSGMPSRDSAKV